MRLNDWRACSYCRSPIRGERTVCRACYERMNHGNEANFFDFDEADSCDFDAYDRLSECSMMADGTCPKAGSEECEFACGLRH